MIARWLACAGLLLAAPPALADAMPNDIDFICHLHHAGGVDLNSITKLPPSLKSWIASNVGAMSDRGGPFAATDVFDKQSRQPPVSSAPAATGITGSSGTNTAARLPPSTSCSCTWTSNSRKLVKRPTPSTKIRAR